LNIQANIKITEEATTTLTMDHIRYLVEHSYFIEAMLENCCSGADVLSSTSVQCGMFMLYSIYSYLFYKLQIQNFKL
jgi:hypothetical protein